MKKYFAAAVLTLSLAITGTSVSYAADFNDVPPTYWAYSSIAAISDKGLIGGDSSGNFNPDDYINKFDTARFFAKMNGYKTANATDADKLQYERIYNKHKNILAKYKNNFTKWDSDANNEISYLLEYQILTEDDLQQFVIMNKNGKEQLRALSREEAALFFVRTMNKTAEADKLEIENPFNDDSSISSNKKSSVYYLRDLGIISGEANNTFIPKGAVTKAVLCVMADKSLTFMDTPLSNQSKNINNIKNITGRLEKVYTSLNVIQLNLNGESKLFKVQDSAEIKIDSYIRNIEDLKAGSMVSAVLNNSDIISLEAKTSYDTDNTNKTDETANKTTDKKNTDNTTDENNKTNIQASSSDSLKYNDSLTTENLSGEILDTGYDKSKGLYFIAVKSLGREFKLTSSQKTILSRNELYGISPSELRKGDTFTAAVKNGIITQLDALGKKYSLTAYITEIRITPSKAEITFSEDGRTEETMELHTDTVDPYSFKVGNRAVITIDSREIISVYVKDNSNEKSSTDYIESIGNGYIILSSSDNKQITVDRNTICLDAQTGEYIKSSSLRKSMKVYVVYDETEKDYARYVTVVE